MDLAILGGSLRQGSLNRRLLEHLARTLEAMGHPVAVLKGEALRLPLYDADLAPDAAVRELHQTLLDRRGLVLVSPEYNAGIPPHLKNAVDWLSTMTPSPFKGLPILLASASPGAFGGARALLSWRPVLANLGAHALPGAITVPLADRNLAEDGAPQDPRTAAEVQKALAALVDLATRLA
jgi:chromate reductase